MADSTPTDHDEYLNRAISEYLVRNDAGEVVTQQEILSKYPDVADRLREFFDDLDYVQTTFPTPSIPETPHQPNTVAWAHIPRVFGHFELRELLGWGATGTVWKAHDTRLDRVVAVKIPHHTDLSAEDMERFLREARVTAQLRHPHVASVHEVGHVDDTVYVVTDYVKGQTLADWRRESLRSVEEVASIVARIADGLEHAHQANIVHRDLKPSNVMVDRQGEPRIVDFGHSKRIEGELTLTVRGNIVGTPAYMSPEQALGEHHLVDRRTDVYALGVVLFELLTGKRPFVGSVANIVHHVVHTEAPRARSIRPTIPRDLDTVCAKCLEKSPSDRYASAAELRDDLRRFIHGEPIHARRVSRVQRARRWFRTHKTVVILGCAVLVLGATGAFGLSRHRAQLQQAEEQRSTTLIHNLLTTEPSAVAASIDELHTHDVDLRPQLTAALADYDPLSPEHLRIRLALSQNSPEHLQYLWSMLPSLGINDVLLVRDVLVPCEQSLTDELWSTFTSEVNPMRQRLNAAAVLAVADTGNPNWHEMNWMLADQLALVRTHEIHAWSDAFFPIGDILVEPLIDEFHRRKHNSSVAVALTRYAADQPELLLDLLASATPTQLRPISDILVRHPDLVEKRLTEVVETEAEITADSATVKARLRNLLNATAVLFRLGQREYLFKFLHCAPDPQLRTALMPRIAGAGCPYESVLSVIEAASDDGVRAALVLSLGQYGFDDLPLAKRREVAADLLTMYRTEHNCAVRAAIGWLLRSWGHAEELKEVDSLAHRDDDNGGWTRNSQGQTFVLIPGPATFKRGTPADERSREPDETQCTAVLPWSFWMADTEVTVSQFRAFDSDTRRDVGASQLESDQPMWGVSWYDAAAYCNWLSKNEGYPQDQWCYIANSAGEYASGMKIANDFSERAGYRLPLEVEWEYACRAGTTTSGHQGDGRAFLRQYAQYASGDFRTAPRVVGSKKPNDFGLFDMLGNVSEWCQDRYQPYTREGATIDAAGSTLTDFDRVVTDDLSRVHRGGSHSDKPAAIRCGSRTDLLPGVHNAGVGFRVMRIAQDAQP